MAHSCYLLPDCFGPRLRFTFYNQVLTASQRAARHTASSFRASLGVDSPGMRTDLRLSLGPRLRL